MIQIIGNSADLKQFCKNLYMKKNLSNMDRAVRFTIGIILITLFLTQILTGTLGYILMGVGIVLLVTGLASFCPLYALLGICTSRKEMHKV
jgi:fatty-acid desaturase